MATHWCGHQLRHRASRLLGGSSLLGCVTGWERGGRPTQPGLQGGDQRDGLVALASDLDAGATGGPGLAGRPHSRCCWALDCPGPPHMQREPGPVSPAGGSSPVSLPWSLGSHCRAHVHPDLTEAGLPKYPGPGAWDQGLDSLGAGPGKQVWGAQPGVPPSCQAPPDSSQCQAQAPRRGLLSMLEGSPGACGGSWALHPFQLCFPGTPTPWSHTRSHSQAPGAGELHLATGDMGSTAASCPGEAF